VGQVKEITTEVVMLARTKPIAAWLLRAFGLDPTGWLDRLWAELRETD
jgi:hypothetical protein